MKLRLQTDYALRALIYLAHTQRTTRAEEIAEAFIVSKDHLVKVIQMMARHGFVRTYPGRKGGVQLARGADQILVKDVMQAIEGKHGILDCVSDPNVCPMEPGCSLRRLLINAEQAFYDAIGATTVADLCAGRNKGGLANLVIPES